MQSPNNTRLSRAVQPLTARVVTELVPVLTIGYVKPASAYRQAQYWRDMVPGFVATVGPRLDGRYPVTVSRPTRVLRFDNFPGGDDVQP